MIKVPFWARNALFDAYKSLLFYENLPFCFGNRRKMPFLDDEVRFSPLQKMPFFRDKVTFLGEKVPFCLENGRKVPFLGEKYAF